MKGELQEDLLHALFCLKKANISIFRSLLNAEGGGLSITELSALNCIGGCKKKDNDGADQTTHKAMHKALAVSKAAVSQILGSLEKRGYIQRETDRDNRRKIIITLTQKGKTAVDKAGKKMDALMSQILNDFGEKETRNFVLLVNRFSEIVKETVSKND
ncbi:MAG: transcriptional regulator [Treponema sp.]|jgi:DNA-binding MarR family transcriptional regulator|nr:transcriptional regulator [Treponema sp.]